MPGLRIPTEARLGPRLFERFGVDLVTGVAITGRPEEAEPLLPLAIPGWLCIDTFVCGGGWLTGLDVQTNEYCQANLTGQLRFGQVEMEQE